MAPRLQRSAPLPEQLNCCLSVKIGAPQTGRVTADTHTFVHAHNEGCGVLLERVGAITDTVMAEYGRSRSTASKTVTLSKPSSMNLYAKVGVNDRQNGFVAIMPDNYSQIIASMWTSLLSRANVDTTFQLYVYVEKRESKIRRATETRIREVAARILEVPRPPEDVPGPSRLRYHATHLARQVDEPDVVNLVPTRTSEQLGRIDREAAAIAEERQGRGVAVEYMPLRVRIGGQQLVLDVHVDDFRRIANVDFYPPYSRARHSGRRPSR